MHYYSIQAAYNELTKHSHECVVDQLWNNLLHIYFSDPRFLISVQAQVMPTSQSRMDVSLSYVQLPRLKLKTLCVIENKRVEFEGQDAVWADALGQLTQYMLRNRLSRGQRGEDIYGIVTVGRYSRFYVLRARENDLEDHPSTGGGYFEFKQDEMAIDGILRGMKADIEGRGSFGH